jgi:hypothetical protein
LGTPAPVASRHVSTAAAAADAADAADEPAQPQGLFIKKVAGDCAKRYWLLQINLFAQMRPVS